jgi:acyl carrier protein phosphodiesterase
MNYLGHIYFSNDDFELAKANLYGDYVKGSDLSIYPELIQKGIRLHREIDNYIDHHPIIIEELLPILRPDLPKVAPIAVDLIFDHLLAKNWSDFHEKELNSYLDEFYESIRTNELEFSMTFLQQLGRMENFKWMNVYAQFEGLEKLSQGVSRKLNFSNSLPNTPEVFLKNEKEIRRIFYKFMKDAQDHFFHKQ